VSDWARAEPPNKAAAAPRMMMLRVMRVSFQVPRSQRTPG
jgi:hypothetical protein